MWEAAEKVLLLVVLLSLDRLPFAVFAEAVPTSAEGGYVPDTRLNQGQAARNCPDNSFCDRLFFN
jgi:hypothetical protein